MVSYYINIDLFGDIQANKLITRGGLESQFVKGDGSLDSTLYASEDWVIDKGYINEDQLSQYTESFALKTTSILTSDGLSGGGNLSADRTIRISTDTLNDISKGVDAYDYTLGDVSSNGNITSIKLVGDEVFSNVNAEDYAQMSDIWKSGWSIQYLANEYKLVLRRKDDFIISQVDLSSLVMGDLSITIDDTDPNDPEIVFIQDGVEVGRIPASALLTGVVYNGELIGKELHFKDRQGTTVINIDLSPIIDIKADKDTSISAGTGLSGGGSLASNRTINFDTSWGDDRYQRVLTAVDNITISGNEISAIDTKYSAGNGLTLSGTSFSLPVSVTGSGSFVKGVTQGTNGINIELGTPPNTNTTYSNMSLSELNAGTVTTARSISAKTLTDWGTGKFALKSHTHNADDINAGVLNIARIPTGTSGSTVALGNDSRFHTHANKSVLDGITSAKVTEWNANINQTQGDARYALRTRTITGTGSLTGGGNLTANRTIDLSSTTKSDIALGKTAHGWGNFRDYGLGVISNLPSMNQSNQHNSLANSWFRVSSTANSDFLSAGTGISLSYNQDYSNQLFIAHGGVRKGIWYRSKVLGESEFETPIRVWDDGNLPNPATQSWVTSNYVKKSGDNLTGTLVHTQAISETLPLIEKERSNATGIAIIRGKASGYDKGIGIAMSGDLVFGDWSQSGSLSSNWNKVWHDGNLTKLSQLTNDLPSQLQTINLDSSHPYRAILSGNSSSVDLTHLKVETITNPDAKPVFMREYLQGWRDVFQSPSVGIRAIRASTSSISFGMDFGFNHPDRKYKIRYLDNAGWHPTENVALESWVNSQGFLKTAQAPLTNSTTNTISGTQVRRAALTGDVTAAANSNATTIANSAVTHAKYQNVPTNTFLGRVASGTGSVKALSVTEMQNALGVLQNFDNVLSRGGSLTSTRTIDVGPYQFYTKAKSSDNDISIDVAMNTALGAPNSSYFIQSKSSLSNVGSSIDIRPNSVMLSSWSRNDPEFGRVRISTNRSTGTTVFSADLKTYKLTQSRTFLFPNESGTLATREWVSDNATSSSKNNWFTDTNQCLILSDENHTRYVYDSSASLVCISSSDASLIGNEYMIVNQSNTDLPVDTAQVRIIDSSGISHSKIHSRATYHVRLENITNRLSFRVIGWYKSAHPQII